MLRRFFQGRFVRRILPRLVLAGMAAGMLAVSGCVLAASRAQQDFRPIHETMSAEHNALINRTPKYRRPEDTTYLAFPEWYLVFNPQEYAQFIREKPPSEFPFFKSIGQFWDGYIQVYGITRRNYPYNFGDHLMVGVIGGSTTIEYAIRGVYEGSVGRFSEWAGGGTHTAEDAYAAQVAREYGDFVPTLPWFEFPFGRKFAGLWSTTDFFGPHFLRKFERRFSLSMEYGVKFLYAGVIRLGSRAVYGVADTAVYATVRDIPERAFANPDIKRIMPLSDGTWLITVPHYQGFTDTVPGLVRLGVEFEEIAGNDEIMLTIVVPAAWSYNLSAGRPLFTMEMLASPGLKRVAVQAPVKSLGKILRETDLKGLRLEHIFDY